MCRLRWSGRLGGGDFGSRRSHHRVEGAIVSCPLHAWRFDLENDGKELHGYRALTVHALKVADGDVYVSLSA